MQKLYNFSPLSSHSFSLGLPALALVSDFNMDNNKLISKAPYAAVCTDTD
jgi:hypothetical protein